MNTTIKLNSKDIAEAICSDYEWYELRELNFDEVKGWIENNYGEDIMMDSTEVKELLTELRNNNWTMYWFEH